MLANRRLLWLTFLLFTGAPLIAAEKISIRTLSIGAAEMPEVFVMGTGKKGHLSLEWSDRQPSKPAIVKCGGVLPLYKQVVDTEGETVYVVTNKIQIPVNAREILLLGWTNGEHIKYQAIEDDFLKARFRDWLLVNLSSRPVAFKVGDSDPVHVASGDSEHYRIAASRSGGAEVLARATIDNEIKTFYSTYWPVRDGRRTIILFADDGRKIRLKRISDILPKPKK